MTVTPVASAKGRTERDIGGLRQAGCRTEPQGEA
jgi:hypothetical protein